MDSETHAGAGQRPVAVHGCGRWRCLVVAVRGGGRWRRFVIVICSRSLLLSFVHLRSALVFSVAGLAFGKG